MKKLLVLVVVVVVMFSGFRPSCGTPIGLSSFALVVNASSGNVGFLYPDWDPSRAYLKAPGVIVAQLSDWSATGIVYGMERNMPQQQGLDTSPSMVDTSTGRPLVGSTIVIFSGPVVHSVVRYYEQNHIAPTYFFYDQFTGTFQFRRAGDGSIVAAMVASDVRGGRVDLFIVEAFLDASGRMVFIGYGFGWKGTFAAAKTLKDIIYGPNGQNIGLYTKSWYIYSWIDRNNDGFPDTHEMAPVASGN
jgi:hypothetical protein